MRRFFCWVCNVPECRSHLPLDVDVFPGQAESGKSTVLKNFQLHFSPKAFEAEVSIRLIDRFPTTADPQFGLGHSLASCYTSQFSSLRQFYCEPHQGSPEFSDTAFSNRVGWFHAIHSSTGTPRPGGGKSDQQDLWPGGMRYR